MHQVKKLKMWKTTDMAQLENEVCPAYYLISKHSKTINLIQEIYYTERSLLAILK